MTEDQFKYAITTLRCSRLPKCMHLDILEMKNMRNLVRVELMIRPTKTEEEFLFVMFEPDEKTSKEEQRLNLLKQIQNWIKDNI